MTPQHLVTWFINICYSKLPLERGFGVAMGQDLARIASRLRPEIPEFLLWIWEISLDQSYYIHHLGKL